jgi:hypothetical protein
MEQNELAIDELARHMMEMGDILRSEVSNKRLKCTATARHIILQSKTTANYRHSLMRMGNKLLVTYSTGMP